MRAAVLCLFVMSLAACVALVAAEGPILEYAPTPGGPWQPDPEAVVLQLPGGNLQVWTPTDVDSGTHRQRFYRLVTTGSGVSHCPLRIRRALTMEFLAPDLDSDGDSVPDCQDLCPGYDDRLDENGNNIPDDCEIPGMVRVPAGPFEMGDALGEGGGEERPRHTVYLSAFYIERYEVTKAVWDQVHAWGLAHGYLFDNAGAEDGWPENPVTTISWYDATKWCNARSEREGLTPVYETGTGEVLRTGRRTIASQEVRWAANGYRLPTEAEWEKAARGGFAGRRFPWGDTISHDQANYVSTWTGGHPLYEYDLAMTPGTHPAFNGTAPIGSFSPTGYGLHDMAGNVAEWCWDAFESGWYQQSAATEADPRGPTVLRGSLRVLRGGGWSTDAAEARSARRATAAPATAWNHVGVRCVRSTP